MFEMMHRKMNDSRRDRHRSRSSSPANYERNSKRRKLGRSSSPGFKTSSIDSGRETNWTFRNMKRELATLRNKLFLSEATVTKYQDQRKRSDEFFETEKTTLKRRARLARETIQRLERDLEISKKTTHEARRDRAIAEAELSRVKTRMEQRITELLKANSKSQEEFKLQNIELKNARITIERLMSEKRRCETKRATVDNLQRTSTLVTEKKTTKPALLPSRNSSAENGDKLPSAKTSSENVSSRAPNDCKNSSSKVPNKDISSPSAVPYRHKVGSSSDSSESSSESSSDSPFYSSSDCLSVSSSGSPLSSSSQESDDNFNNSEEAEERRSRRLRIGTFRYVLVSSRDFFWLDWSNEYSRPESGNWDCKKCSRSVGSRQAIEDHVWSKHYAGDFECPYCIIANTRSAARYNIMMHIRRIHPDQYARPKRW